MTRAQVKAKVRENLDDAGVTFYSEDDLNDSIQDGYNLVVASTGCIQRATLFPRLAETHWKLAPSIPDFLYLTAIYDYETKRWLKGVSRRQLRVMREDWELQSGSLLMFSIPQIDRVSVYPHPAEAKGACLIYYRALAPELTDATPLLIPSAHEDIIEFYSTADLLEQAKELTQAANWWDEFYSDLPRLKRAVSLSAKSDRMFVLAPYLEMGLYGEGSGNSVNIDNEVPSGIMDGVNTTFTLNAIPNPSTSLCLYLNGQMLFQGIGYYLTGNTITYTAGNQPSSTDAHRAFYRI